MKIRNATNLSRGGALAYFGASPCTEDRCNICRERGISNIIHEVFITIGDELI